MRFEEAYGGWQGGPLPQEEALSASCFGCFLLAFCLRTISLHTICESSRFLRTNPNHIMGYTSQLKVINI
jgi:hypothetical protein